MRNVSRTGMISFRGFICENGTYYHLIPDYYSSARECENPLCYSSFDECAMFEQNNEVSRKSYHVQGNDLSSEGISVFCAWVR